MSGLVVRPGDTLVMPLDPGKALTPADLEKIKRAAEGELPGVTVVLFQGMGGSSFVYRPGDAE
jgi:hypothetical protein